MLHLPKSRRCCDFIVTCNLKCSFRQCKVCDFTSWPVFWPHPREGWREREGGEGKTKGMGDEERVPERVLARNMERGWEG